MKIEVSGSKDVNLIRKLDFEINYAMINFALGGVAQLGERLNGIQEVASSILAISTIFTYRKLVMH
jgi:hypothetical protein